MDDKAGMGAEATMQDMVLGNPDAPVTIIEYASLTCPHCATFHKEVLPQLKTEYIDTGKAKLIFRDFPFDRFALSASMLARCSGPDRFFPFLDLLFKQQANWIGNGQPDEVLANLKRLAGLTGMDEAAVQACLGNEALTEFVLNERLTGNKEFGVESTPTFIVGEDKYPGVRRIEEWRGIIDPMLPASTKESRAVPAGTPMAAQPAG
ncbi:MAG: DsbA family protein [Sneathiellaceae bacterium]